MVYDTAGERDIRGLDIDKLAKGFADEAIIMKQFCTVSKTKAREIRWYAKQAGFLDSTDTEVIVASQIPNVPFGAKPVTVEQKWQRDTSYVKKYFVESPTISEEDIKDSDIDVLAGNVRDLVRAVGRQVDKRIYDVITTLDVGTGSSTLAITHEWDDADNAVPISDLLHCKEKLKNYNYEPKGAIFLARPDVERFLLNHLISVKGSSIPQYASGKIEKGIIMEILGFKFMTSTIVTSDKAVIFVPKRACTWKTFMPITSKVIHDPGIGKKIRVWEEGEAILTDPYAVVYITNIGPT